MTDAAASIASTDKTTRLIPGGAAGLAQLTDEELLANTRRLVGKSNQLLAALLLHLAEVEVRGVHRTRRRASLYTYCIYELRFSEDAAAQSFCPPVRELPPGERPRDWANDGIEEPNVENASVTERDLPIGPVPGDLPPVTSPQRYQLQFSTIEEHVQLIERAKALMARERPGVSLGELHLEAMKLLVASLEKRKFRSGVTSQPRQRGAEVSEPRQRGVSGTSRERNRHIPAALRREVYERDPGRCSYVDARGERCCETRYFELHHLVPFAQGGEHRASNLALRCSAHNRLAAERDFGQELMAARSDAARHESLSRQRVDDGGLD